uniref:Uncharacterized protein n=1 Tax=Arundo donax TaxID=35708 RepID=A0A0A9D7U2_ARUDO
MLSVASLCLESLMFIYPSFSTFYFHVINLPATKQMEMSRVHNLVMAKLESLTKEVQQLRRENQQLRHQLL